MPEISLITATYGRINEIPRLLDSLIQQTFKDFELIIIDQNEHYEVQKILEKYKELLNIHYIRSSQKGLSHNRNIGLEKASGDIFAFPDDDCYYDGNVLECVHQAFKDKELKYLCFDLYDDIDNNFCWKKVDRVSSLKRRRLYYNGNSINFFIRANTNRFDECFGVGAKYGAGEETDYLFQNIGTKDIGKPCFEAKIYHNSGTGVHVTYEKYYKYAIGFGAMCKKDFLLRKSIDSIFLFLKYVIRTFAGILLKKDKKIYWLGLKGRICGFVIYKS